jgi:hypothetical protein
MSRWQTMSRVGLKQQLAVRAAFGSTLRQLQERLAAAGLTGRGELRMTSIAPLEIDE